MKKHKFLNDVFDENGSVYAESPGGNILLLRPTDDYVLGLESCKQFKNVVDTVYDKNDLAFRVTFIVENTQFSKEFQLQNGKYTFTNGTLTYIPASVK